MHRGLLLLLLAAFIMALGIVYAFVFGHFIAEAKVLFPLPWFQLTLLDLYLGFFIFSGWIFFREPSHAAAVVWLIAICLLGNLAAGIYAVLALIKANGDWIQFWMGHRALKLEGN